MLVLSIATIVFIAYNLTQVVILHTSNIINRNHMYSKTLGPENARLLTTLVSQKHSIFAIDDACQILGKSYQATVVLLQRLKKSGWVVGLGAGKYAVVPLDAGNDAQPGVSPLVIARALIGDAPYYISYESACGIHQMFPSTNLSVFVTTTRRIPTRHVLKVSYKFITAKPTSFWGCRLVKVTPEDQVNVSDLERTIVDGLARPELCGGLSKVIFGLCNRKNDLDFGKMITYAKKMGNQAVAKRLGYLLEHYQLGTPHEIGELQASIGSSYILLDPQSQPAGKYTARWRLRLNAEIDDCPVKETTLPIQVENLV